jgi:hypothetical protein
VVKISWYGDVHFEHAVNGFLVAQKESVKNIHKQLENAVDKSTVFHWAS